MTRDSDMIPDSNRKMVMRRNSAGWYEPSADGGVDESRGSQQDISCDWPATNDSPSRSPGPPSPQSLSPGSLEEPPSPQSLSPGSLEDKGSQNDRVPLDSKHTAGTLSHNPAPQQLKTIAGHEEVTCLIQADSTMVSHIAREKILPDLATPHTPDSASLRESSSGAVTSLSRLMLGPMECLTRHSLHLKSQWSFYRTLVCPTILLSWFQTHCLGDRSLYSASTIFRFSIRSWLVAMLLLVIFSLVFIPLARPFKEIPSAPPSCAETMKPGHSMVSIVEVGDDSLWALMHASRLNSLPAALYTKKKM